MADPLSIAASAISLAAIAAHSSRVLVHLCRETKDAPDLVLALSNEVADLGLVLDKASAVLSSSPGGNRSSHAAADPRLLDMLTGAKALLSELDNLSRQLQDCGKTAKRIKWQLKKFKAADLKGRLRDARERIFQVLVSFNLASSSRIELELHGIRVHTPSTETLNTLTADTCQVLGSLNNSGADDQ